MKDDRATAAITAATNLAVILRDEGPDSVRKAARRLLSACNNDVIAALCVTAALVRVEWPVDAWWQDGLAAVAPAERIRPHGTHDAFERHRENRETPCDECVIAEGAWQKTAQSRRWAA